MISKRDVKDAFKFIPVSAKGLAYMGRRFAKFVRIYLSTFSDGDLRVSTLSMQYISAQFPNNDHVEGPESFVAYQYLDSGAFIEPWLGLRPW